MIGNIKLRLTSRKMGSLLADHRLLNRVINQFDRERTRSLAARPPNPFRLRSQQGSAELVIEDNGPGFPPDIIARAFERFVKGKHSKGHGLGLAFVHAVVQAHGGTIKISDHPGGGAVITLSLPAYEFRAPNHTSEPITSSPTQAPTGRKHSLYAERN